jgi:hypothetical protein
VILFIAVAVAAAYYLIAPRLGFRGDEEVPPRVNADGTTDYVLLSVFVKKQPRSYWVMRIPSDIAVRVSENEDVGSVGTGAGSVGFRDRANDYIEMFFDEATLEPLTKNAIESLSSKRMQAIEVRFLSSRYAKSIEQTLTEAEKYCVEVPSEFQELRTFKFNPEKVAQSDQLKCLAHTLEPNTRDVTGYLLKPREGQHAADLRCSKDIASGSSSRCSGVLALPNNQSAMIWFYPQVLPIRNFAELVAAVEALAAKSVIQSGEVPPGSHFKFE